ncbi:unnamed protein product [Moneuplotes crassus]|uniref:Uncharacterized protein n=1 Tax=Euplotes crassus TaxID=5936 RepID=A0AAD1XZB4_EUPCR|nr:unnamed protein product [Moneuplotes crassus]
MATFVAIRSITFKDLIQTKVNPGFILKRLRNTPRQSKYRCKQPVIAVCMKKISPRVCLTGLKTNVNNR